MRLRESPLYRDGPIPRGVHGAVEYGAGALFLAAPFIFSFDSDAARALSIAVGVLVLVIAAVSRGPSGMVEQIPPAVHFGLDLVLAGFLIAAPFLFGFTDEGSPTAFFIVVGALHLLITIGTRFQAEPS